MRHRLVEAAAVVVVIAVGACGKDKGPAPVQQAAEPASTTKAPATKAPATRAPAAPSPEALASAELAKATLVRTVQVSSFESATPAKWWMGELQKQGIPAYVTTAVVDSQEWTRLRVGAAVSGAEARAIAEKIRARYHWPTWIVMVDDRSELPANALLASRNYVAGR